jgi:hypothetical protein
MAGMMMLELLRPRAWEWGRVDCCATACEVFGALTGIDPMAHLRGRYSDLRGAAQIIKDHGGFEAMFDALSDRAGLVPSDGRAGDIGLIRAGVLKYSLAISTGSAWATMARDGMVFLPVEHVRASRA